MHARVVSLEVNRLKLTEGLQVYREQVAPAAQKQLGFAGILLLLDREIGHAASITFWQTVESRKASGEGDYYNEQVARLQPYFVEDPKPEDYEVGVIDDAETSKPPKVARVVRATFHASRADEGVKVYDETLMANARK